MPAARTATKRSVAGPSAYASSPASSSSASPLTPADHHLLGYVNNMRKCCDMAMFYSNLSEQGSDFITDSLVHARQIFATYATSSQAVASPSKLAAELLKSPTRTRTRSKATTTRSRAPLAGSADPFADCIDITDKENAPQPGRAKRSRVQPASDTAVKLGSDEAVRPARAALVDATLNSDALEPAKKKASKPAKASRRPLASQDDSMADDATAAVQNKDELEAPRASTPPPTVASPPKEVATLTDLDAISVFDSDNEDESFAQLPKEPQESTTASQIVQNDVTCTSSNGDKTQASDHTTSSSRLDSAQQAAAALLASKLAQHKDTSVDKPVKRTLASYGAKKSLPAAAHNARASVTTALHPASTPAGPSFRSSFLNKSLRKQIADQQALDDSDDDSDSDDDDMDDQTDHRLGPKAATQANTRANATIVSQPAKKRKSDESHEVTTTTTTTASDTSMRSPRSVHKAPKLAAMTTTAKASALAAGAKKTQPVGPASKLEQFRNNLAHVTRTTDSSASSASTSSQPSFASATSKVAPTSPVTRSSAKAAAAAAPSVDSVLSDSSAELTEKVVGNKSGESTIKASAIPRSPVRSPSRAGATSPLRPPPRSGSVRSSPRKLAEQLEKEQTVVRAASPTRTRGANPFQRAPGSPPAQTRSIAALFNSPKASSKLPTLAAQPVSTTPAHSPPKALQLAKVPFPRSSIDKSKQAKPLPAEPAPAAPKEAVRVPSVASSSIRSVSEALRDEDAFFDADEGANDAKPKVTEQAAPAQPAKAAAPAKTAPVSPKKVVAAAKVVSKAPASPAKTPSRTGTLRGLTASPGKSRTPAGAASPSRAWGLGDKIKGFLGLHANNTTAAQGKISASNAFQPRPRDPAPAADSAPAVETKQISIPGALLASPAAKPAPAPAVHSTPTSSSAALVGGKPASLARAELLRKKQAEEEERKAKEKEERRKMLLAKKEERAKAVAEEELGKESKKRARDGTAATEQRAGVRTADQSTASVVIPSALLGSGASANTSRVSTVSTASSGSAPTRPSSAMNGSYAGVKSRYMQPSSINAPTMQHPAADANKKRRITAERDQPAASAAVTAQQARPAPAASAPSAPSAPPKLARTVSQSSIRPPHTQPQPAAAQQQPAPAPQQIKLAVKPAPTPATNGSTSNGFSAAPRMPTTAAPKPALAQQPSRPMANANFSSANPFQQAKQQQLQLQQQQQQQMIAKQKQMQMQMQQAAMLREQELHRAAQKQFHAQHGANARYDEDAGQDEAAADEPLPDIASEYSDSEDEETIQKRAAMPAWTQGDALDAALLAQSTVDADEIFGIPQGPVELEKILPGERTLNRIRRPRSSSANWSGQDGLAQWEIDRYNKRMGIKAGAVQLAGSSAPAPPPLARMSMANRPSTSSAVFHPSGLSHSTQAPTPAAHRKDDRKL